MQRRKDAAATEGKIPKKTSKGTAGKAPAKTTKSLTVRLDPDILKKFKKQAERNGKNQTEYLEDLVKLSYTGCSAKSEKDFIEELVKNGHKSIGDEIIIPVKVPLREHLDNVVAAKAEGKNLDKYVRDTLAKRSNEIKSNQDRDEYNKQYAQSLAETHKRIGFFDDINDEDMTDIDFDK